MSKKNKHKSTKPKSTPPVPAIAAEIVPAIPDDIIHQVIVWILEGATEFSLRETLTQKHPNTNATSAIKLALDRIARQATNPAIPIDNWCIESAKLIYQRQLEIGEYAAALRTVRHIDELAQRQIKPPSPEASVAQPVTTVTKPTPAETALLDPDHQSRDARMINRAIKQGWKIPERILAKLPETIATAFENATNPRDLVALSRLLITLHGQNIRAKPPTKKVRHQHEIKPTPITEANLEDRRRELSARIAGISQDTGGTGAG